MLKLISIIMLLATGMAVSSALAGNHSERFIRAQVVQLHTDHASCSGEQVMAPSGKTYILTAAHCRDILSMSGARITDSQGHNYTPHFVAEDRRSDLLLLRGIPNRKGLKIAKHIREQEHVRSFTHGAGYRTYKTEGDVIQDTPVKISLFLIDGEESMKKCSMPKYKIFSEDSIFGPMTQCILDVKEMVATAPIVPGSSGGPLVNASGELVGVVSAGNPSQQIFGFYVRLIDIQRFLKKR